MEEETCISPPPALPLTSCVTLGKALDLSGLLLPALNRRPSSDLIED